MGSGEKTLVWYYDIAYIYTGGFGIQFSSTVKYVLLSCGFYTSFPTTLPSELEKHWVVEKHGYRTIIFCNGQLVLDITASSKTCYDPNFADTWDNYWSRNVDYIRFSSVYDTATHSYSIGWLIS